MDAGTPSPSLPLIIDPTTAPTHVLHPVRDPPTAPKQGGGFMGLKSNVSYDFERSIDGRGTATPQVLGVGNFAIVYRGHQRCDGEHVRPVAIKILRPEATYADETLFEQEIRLLRSLTENQGVRVVHLLDVLSLPPLLLCGCGEICEPRCPRCQQPLCGVDDHLRDGRDEPQPSLGCACGYRLPGRELTQRLPELLVYPAKPCCRSGAHARTGRMINFVNRKAVVMEELGLRLSDFIHVRREQLRALRQKKGLEESPAKDPRQDPAQRRRTPSLWRRLRHAWTRDSDTVIEEKVILLDKVRLMVQLAEAVAWLHGDAKIIHKDLAPDNVMIRQRGQGDWRGEHAAAVRYRDILNERASSAGFSIELIDFGLADRDQPTRSWYADGAATGTIKEPFLSPEARDGRMRPISPGERIRFERDAGRFRLPDSMVGERRTPLAGDLLIDLRDYEHRHDLRITRVEGGFAWYEGDPPSEEIEQRFALVRPLCEPHDIYALGALYYFILAESTELFTELRSLTQILERDPSLAITREALWERDSYPALRNGIREGYWRDELMVLILRALTRSRPESFVSKRTQRGREPAQQLLRETQRLFHRMQSELLGSYETRQRLVTGVVAGTLALGVSATSLGLWVNAKGKTAAAAGAQAEMKRQRDAAVTAHKDHEEQIGALAKQLRDAENKQSSGLATCTKEKQENYDNWTTALRAKRACETREERLKTQRASVPAAAPAPPQKAGARK